MLMFHEKWRNYHDSRGGTDTPGPGESVSAIRFIGKFDFSRKKRKNKKNEKRKNAIGFESRVVMGKGITESQNSQIAGYFRSRDSWAVWGGDAQAPAHAARQFHFSRLTARPPASQIAR